MPNHPNRIQVTHAGALPRPDSLRALVNAREAGQAYDPATLAAQVRTATADVVARQLACGVDSVNDGEAGKFSWFLYVHSRIQGIEEVSGPSTAHGAINGRDMAEFAGYFETPDYQVSRRGRGFGTAPAPVTHMECTGPLVYAGHAEVAKDTENLRAALQQYPAPDAFLPAIAPGAIEHWLTNRHYANQESFLFAIADALHQEYQAIVDAGFRLQIDDPDLADGWQIYPSISVPDYQRHAALRIEALNHALRGIPADRVRLHMCWGSYRGPHKYDIPLSDVAELILRVNAGQYAIEASNPRHEHEWVVWQGVKLPDDKVLVPGVVGHVTDTIEHPELVAQRLLRYARVVGRDRVMAGTDCGLGPRTAHESICWAKLQALAQGAAIASKQLWK